MKSAPPGMTGGGFYKLCMGALEIGGRRNGVIERLADRSQSAAEGR
jgi:hypothetical protein